MAHRILASGQTIIIRVHVSHACTELLGHELAAFIHGFCRTIVEASNGLVTSRIDCNDIAGRSVSNTLVITNLESLVIRGMDRSVSAIDVTGIDKAVEEFQPAGIRAVMSVCIRLLEQSSGIVLESHNARLPWLKR